MKREVLNLLVDEVIEKAENDKLKKITKELLLNGKKKWWFSKTLWVNIIAIAAIIIQGETGFIVSLELQVSVLAAVNVILRLITGEELEK